MASLHNVSHLISRIRYLLVVPGGDGHIIYANQVTKKGLELLGYLASNGYVAYHEINNS